MRKAIVVLSGGQDSVTCLGYALQRYDEVHAIGFRYSQKHVIELEQASLICSKLGVDFRVHEIPSLAALADSALTTGGDVNQAHHSKPHLPASFVPNRNALFLTIAHAYAQKVGASVIVTGVNQVDYSGYPDCRPGFIGKLEDALNTGYETGIVIKTPLIGMNKAQIFALAQEVGVLDIVIEDSHTCYNGDRSERHDWGYGCGKCPACALRKKGWEEFLEWK